jgi:hypothetical protein
MRIFAEMTVELKIMLENSDKKLKGKVRTAHLPRLPELQVICEKGIVSSPCPQVYGLILRPPLKIRFSATI